jgi:predicted small metal-binding protein
MQLNAGQIELNNTVDWINSSWQKYLQNVDKPNPVHDLYPQAVVDITAKASRFADDDIFPETLKMDQNRVVAFFNSWQDVTILATIMIVFKQSAGPKCSIVELEQAKKDIWILLNDSESTMEHVTIQMAHGAGKIRGKPLTANEITGIDTVTNNALAPGSKIYDLVQKRIGLHLENALSKQPINKTELEKHGLTIIQEEIENMVKKFVPVSDLNRAVYSSIYATIIEHIRKGTPIKEISDQIIESLE